MKRVNHSLSAPLPVGRCAALSSAIFSALWPLRALKARPFGEL